MKGLATVLSNGGTCVIVEVVVDVLVTWLGGVGEGGELLLVAA